MLNRLQKIMSASLVMRAKEVKEYIQHPEYRDLLKKNERFKNIHKGKRCFVIGNGPSINQQDLSLLSDEIVFTVNQLPRNPQFEKVKTNYHVWVDERFFDLKEDSPEDMELLEVMKKVNTDGENRPIVFYKNRALEMIKKYKLDESLDIYYLGDCYLEDKKRALRRLLSICRYVPVFPTVIDYIICIAVYMGFSEIYLLGCDCTGIVSLVNSKLNKGNEAAYGYKISDNEKKRLEKVVKLTTIKEEMQSYIDLFDTYELLFEYCRRNGTMLYNATDGGLLEGVPRVNLEEVIKREL